MDFFAIKDSFARAISSISYGCGNDYVYVNGMAEKIEAEKKPDLVRRMSERHFGVGSDGVIFINASEQADFEI